ncbi:MAG: DUF2723 domain-containing protein [Anaerolineales bacterium]|nr:DUF2723 domain-containing protein [Anaerolineales bacterium]
MGRQRGLTAGLLAYPPAASRDARLPLLATGGATFGLALARYLFEINPIRLAWLSTWPGALCLAALGAWAGLLALATHPPQDRPGVDSGPPRGAWAGLALLLPLAAVLPADVNPLRTLTLVVGSLLLFALLLWIDDQPARRFRLALTLTLFGLLFLVYLSGLAPAVGEADTFEFQVGIARLGIAHGSGYPLLMLLGRLFASLPVGGTLAFRANLTSAFFGALAGVGAHQLARSLGAAAPAALLAGLAFGLSPTLWSRAVEVEAYTLNAAFVAALLLLAVRLADKERAAPRAARRALCLLALLFGLSLANHLTTLLLAPAAALAALVALRQVARASVAAPARALGLMMLFFAVGLSVYLYVPLRWPAVNDGHLMSLAQFANLLAGNEARGAFQWQWPFRDAGRYAIVANKLVGEYGWAGLGLAALGLSALTWRSRLLALVLLLGYLPYLYFALAFNVPDPDFSAFLIPLHLMAAALMGIGVQALVNWAQPRAGPAGRKRANASQPVRVHRERLARIAGRNVEVVVTAPPPGPRGLGAFWRSAVLAGVALLPLASFWRTLPAVDQSRDWERYRQGELMLAQPLAPDAAVLADSQKIAPLYYLQVVEGVRPDLDIIVLPDEASYRSALDERLAGGQTVYLARYLPGLGASYSLRSVGPLAEVATRPFLETSLALTAPVTQPGVPGIRLLGYAAPHALRAAAPDSVALTLAWQVRAAPEANWLVTLRLVDTSGAVVWQSVGAAPVSGLYPTNAWRVGEIVTDYHQVPLTHQLAPGNYGLEVGLFPPFAAIADTGWALVGTLTVLPPSEPPKPPRLIRAQLDSAWLLGYALPDSVTPGAQVPVTLYWLRSAGSDTVTAFGEPRSLAAWPEGALAPQTYLLGAPQSGAAMRVVAASGRPARCGWLAPVTTGCALPSVRLAGAAATAAAINFDHALLLLRAVLLTARAHPGDEVSVELEWQGLQRMAEDYTIFVHLLGPDGQVHGQVDAWPVSGTRATSSWVPGDVIRDPYRVRVPDDAPAGSYQIEIGVYLLANNQRLPVLNALGQPVDDRVLIPGLSVEIP